MKDESIRFLCCILNVIIVGVVCFFLGLGVAIIYLLGTLLGTIFGVSISKLVKRKEGALK